MNNRKRKLARDIISEFCEDYGWHPVAKKIALLGAPLHHDLVPELLAEIESALRRI